MSNKAAAPLFALVAVLSWGAMFPIAAHAIPRVEPFHLTALRYGIASLLFVALLWRAEGLVKLRPEGRALGCGCSARSASPASTCSATSGSSTPARATRR